MRSHFSVGFYLLQAGAGPFGAIVMGFVMASLTLAVRIIDDELWNAAKARQVALKTNGGPNSLRDRRRPKYVFSGLIKCAWCGVGYAMISAALTGCSTARNKGTSENRSRIQLEQLEGRDLNALRNHLMDQALFKEFYEFTREMKRLRMDETARSELKRI